MKVFKNLEEMQPYYSKEDNAYHLWMLDVKFDFDLEIDGDIYARAIEAKNIKANNIEAHNIKAKNIKANNIKAFEISTGDINAQDIDAFGVRANNINARDIKFYGVCFAYSTFVCKSIRGQHANAKYFCLDNDVVFEESAQQ